MVMARYLLMRLSLQTVRKIEGPMVLGLTIHNITPGGIGYPVFWATRLVVTLKFVMRYYIALKDVK